MKLTTPLLLLALGSFALLGPALLAAAPARRSAAPVAVQEESFDEWKAKFQRAQKIAAKDEMASLVAKNTRLAVGWVVRTCEDIAKQSSEELEVFIAGLREAWETSIETAFVKKYYEYLALLDPALVREREKLVEKFRGYEEQLTELAGPKDASKYIQLANYFEGLADGFLTVGDHYYASQSWFQAGFCRDEGQQGPDANLFKVCRAYGNMLEQREAIELRDQLHREVKVFHDRLVRQGYDQDEAEAAKKPGPGAGVIAAAEPLVVTPTFALVEELEAIQRPAYYADELYPLWPSLSFGRKGSRATLAALEKSPVVLRPGSNEVVVDVNGDGDGEDDADVDVPLTGNVEPVRLRIGEGETAVDWAFLAVIGIQNETYQGFQMNLAPADEALTLYIAPAASMTGEIAGTPVQILDDNMDGIYGSPPKPWGHAGMSKGNYQQDLDALVVDGAKRALPWSEFQKIGDAWYHLEVEQAGKRLRATPIAELETGTLKLKYKGGKPRWVVVQGTGRFQNSYFDLVGGGSKGVEVPAGTYKLFYGVLDKGNKKQMSKAMIRGGPGTVYEVEAGENTTVELGAPYGFDFSYDVAERTILVEGMSLVVTGSGGERYERLWNCVPQPEVSYREKGGRRGSKGEEMEVVGHQDQISEIEKARPGQGWAATYFPLDLEIPKKGEDAVEVQLVEKKNRLFGKIESEWK